MTNLVGEENLSKKFTPTVLLLVIWYLLFAFSATIPDEKRDLIALWFLRSNSPAVEYELMKAMVVSDTKFRVRATIISYTIRKKVDWSSVFDLRHSRVSG